MEVEEEEAEERGQRCYCFLEQPGGTTGPFRKEGRRREGKQTNKHMRHKGRRV